MSRWRRRAWLGVREQRRALRWLGLNLSNPSGFGVFANGNLELSGTKSFRIDHPTDPENKYLLHYSVESPEVLNTYSGKITLNDAGEAVVQLPAYFSAINKRSTLHPYRDRISDADAACRSRDQRGRSQSGRECGAETSGTDLLVSDCRRCRRCEGLLRVEAVRNDRWVRRERHARRG
jgi:hypothetical protein